MRKIYTGVIFVNIEEGLRGRRHARVGGVIVPTFFFCADRWREIIAVINERGG